MAKLRKGFVADGGEFGRGLANWASTRRTEFEVFRRVRGGHKPMLPGLYISMQSRGLDGNDDRFRNRLVASVSNIPNGNQHIRLREIGRRTTLRNIVRHHLKALGATSFFLEV